MTTGQEIILEGTAEKPTNPCKEIHVGQLFEVPYTNHHIQTHTVIMPHTLPFQNYPAEHFQNRELGVLAFNERVLAQTSWLSEIEPATTAFAA